jgi:guanine deaminase
MTTIGIRGAFFDFVDDPWKHVGREPDAARFHADGLMVIEDGRIADFGAFGDLSRRHRALDVTHVRDRLILPGFIDGHIHFPQTASWDRSASSCCRGCRSGSFPRS